MDSTKMQASLLCLTTLLWQSSGDCRDIEWLTTTKANRCVVALDREYTGRFDAYRGTGLLEVDRHPNDKYFGVTHIWIGPDGTGRTVRSVFAQGKRTKPPTAATPGLFVYVKDLPEIDDLVQIQDGNRILEMFSDPQGFHDGWGHFAPSGKRICGKTASWCAFTLNEDESLRIVSMFVMLEGDGKRWKITDCCVRQGTLTAKRNSSEPVISDEP